MLYLLFNDLILIYINVLFSTLILISHTQTYICMHMYIHRVTGEGYLLYKRIPYSCSLQKDLPKASLKCWLSREQQKRIWVFKHFLFCAPMQP